MGTKALDCISTYCISRIDYLCLLVIEKMHRLIFFAILAFSSISHSHPFGPTPVPYATDVFRPTAAPVSPTVLPFGPSIHQFQGNPYNNPYYKYNQAGPNVPILTYSNTQDVKGSYAFSFTTGDGKQVQESGYLKDAYIDNTGEPQGIQVVQGSYAYIAPDGTPIQVTYVADENGYRPSEVNIPSDGKTPTAFPIGNTYEKENKHRIANPFHRNYNQFDRYDPYYQNDGRNYFAHHRFEPYKQNTYYEPNRYLNNNPKYYNNPASYYQNGYRYEPNWHNSYPGFVPLSQVKPKEDSKDN